MVYSIKQLCSREGLQHTFNYLLPIVEANTTITYGEIAARLEHDLGLKGRIFRVHIGHVAGSLMHRILELDGRAPLINLLVVNQGTHQPSNGADDFLRMRFRLPQKKLISTSRRRTLVEQAAKAVYGFKAWPQLYQRLFDEKPPPTDPVLLIKGNEVDGIPPTPRFGGPPESDEHKRLKQYILENPREIGAKAAKIARTEEMLLSGDEVDVYFDQGELVHLVEVKSVRSTEPDFRRGVYQCIKYRAVFQAMRASAMPSLRIKAVLVLEREPPPHITALAKSHNVRLAVVPVNSIA